MALLLKDYIVIFQSFAMLQIVKVSARQFFRLEIRQTLILPI
jgi:hypothetical protein